jgi:RNA polymerase sigma-70 factor (ECF subfamily)
MEPRAPLAHCSTCRRAPSCTEVRCRALVQRATAADRGAARAALEAVIELSWPSVRAIARRSGLSPADADDATQSYFARFLEKDYVRQARDWHGCFRPFLLSSVRHFLSNRRQHERARKRGGGKRPVSLEEACAARLEPVESMTPETLLESARTRQAIGRALRALEREARGARGRERLEALADHLAGAAAPDSYRTLAARWGVGESAVRVAVHRLRRRLALLLMRETTPRPCPKPDQPAA